MKVKYKEEPGAWRKSTLLTTLGLALFSTLLLWRRVLPAGTWLAILASLAFISLLVCLRPAWFRGYYRFSTWVGFWSSQAVARVVLVLIFFGIFVPAGWLMRLLGKDALGLKAAERSSYWSAAAQTGPLDRLF